MTDRSVTHATFVLEHFYTAPPARVFGAWADPAVKTSWFSRSLDPEAPPLELDFRVGGRERSRSAADGGQVITYEGWFRDIVPEKRIVVANWIDVNDQRISVSQVTAEMLPEGAGTRLVVTEQGAYLDGLDNPDSRADGMRAQLKALGVELQSGGAMPATAVREGAELIGEPRDIR